MFEKLVAEAAVKEKDRKKGKDKDKDDKRRSAVVDDAPNVPKHNY